MPQAILDRWRRELEKEAGANFDSVLRRRVGAYLDQGYGDYHLKDPRVAEMVQDSLLFYDGERYVLSAWVVMPNHVHLLVAPAKDEELSVILHSLKSYTAHKANRILGRTGRFWQRESFERYIRDYGHFQNVVAYIENNPVKARLCPNPSDWPHSSAWFRAHKESKKK